MAKNQMLALNIPKLSGHCGKLICCLKYENDAYTDLQKDLPRIGARVKYNDDIYKITSMNVITKIIRLESKDNVINVPYDDIKNCILPREFNPNQQNKKFSPNNKGINDNEKN
jgi:cell fate regulator YaaT (PSP1 superfamily)